VARRDLTVAIAHGKTFLGSSPVWVSGDPEQAAWLGGQVLDGTKVAWALTERHHGADLLAGEVTATRAPGGGWRLDGEKWLINNATRAQVVCVLARTGADGGGRGFSHFLVDKRQLTDGSYSHLPKTRTHGIRGADISGIAFRGTRLPDDALVGQVGDGITTVLRAMQMTRPLCSALSVGAVDHGLRLAVEFAAGRELYGTALIALPNVRFIIGQAVASALLAQAVAVVAARAIGTLTSEMSVISAIAKSFVPTVVEDTLVRVAELLGARGFLTEEFGHGAFSKLQRDHRIVPVFEGSTVVNRNALINQFPVLAAAFRKGRYDASGLAAATTVTQPLPKFEPGQLVLRSREGCSVVQGLTDAVVGLDVPPRVARLVERFTESVRDVIDQVAGYRPTARDVPPAAFALAARYELCMAGAACVHLWLNNPRTGALWHDAAWLEACLLRVLVLLGVDPGTDGAQIHDLLTDLLSQAAADGSSLSLFPAFPTDVPSWSQP
jgi:alkylation response protein AidB-like acyl-CoA dehydrogenase